MLPLHGGFDLASDSSVSFRHVVGGGILQDDAHLNTTATVPTIFASGYALDCDRDPTVDCGCLTV